MFRKRILVTLRDLEDKNFRVVTFGISSDRLNYPKIIINNMCLDNAILTALIAGSFSILSAIVTFLFTERRFKFQLKSQYLSHFVTFRYESIRDVTAKFVRCKQTFDHYLTSGAKNENEVQEIREIVNEYVRETCNANLWLSNKLIKEIIETATLFKRMERHIGIYVGKKTKILEQKDLEDFLKIDRIVDMLREEAGIEEFKKFKREIIKN